MLKLKSFMQDLAVLGINKKKISFAALLNISIIYNNENKIENKEVA